MSAAILSSTTFASPLLAVSMKAESVAGPLTNSILVAIIVTVLILWFVRGALKNPTLVPSGRQNFVELVVEFLYNQVEGIVGRKIAPKAFPLLATLFVYILVSNWFGLLPGVGTIGWGEGHSIFLLHHIDLPLLRPATADLNGTLAMTLIVFVFWTWITLRETGLKGFLEHTFAPKGGLKGIMGLVMIPIFFIVGLIEVFSILLRNLTLPMRLYGNIFAGENVIHTMGSMLDDKGGALAFFGKVALPLPFYFMELLVGILQAMVFALLTAVYIKLATDHGDDHHGEHGDHAEHGESHH